MPPATGSTGLLAVTVTASGLGNAVLAHCGLRRAAGDRREGEPLALERADVGIGRVERLAALVGRDAADERACADGGATGQESHGLGQPCRSYPDAESTGSVTPTMLPF